MHTENVAVAVAVAGGGGELGVSKMEGKEQSVYNVLTFQNIGGWQIPPQMKP